VIKRLSLTSIQNSILNANILLVDLFLLEEDMFQIRYGNEIIIIIIIKIII